MDWTTLAQFLDRFGVAIAVLAWFMLRHEKRMDRAISKINRLLITNVLMCQALNLGDSASDQLIDAAADDDSAAPRRRVRVKGDR